MHATPGGVCTSWRRGEYLFDHCLHWVLGSNAGSSLYPIFEELGVARAITFHHPERFRRIEAFGKTLTVYTDIATMVSYLPSFSSAVSPGTGSSARSFAG
jgi:phytoene dehydrogenase-like protein